MEVEPASKRIAVIGSGAAGLAACFYLQKHHLVTLLEKEKQLGGHIRTEVIPNGP
ncbi:MAG: NADP transhydrogenase subunit alpha, partial [Proteobacteria bacterium]